MENYKINKEKVMTKDKFEKKKKDNNLINHKNRLLNFLWNSQMN